jgi:hypothetical protein
MSRFLPSQARRNLDEAVRRFADAEESGDPFAVQKAVAHGLALLLDAVGLLVDALEDIDRKLDEGRS